ncbi:MAG: helix-turn-helix transcriptional regulator [bacterium]|nr:helix-turn-helix transcriptional regulator [bacterium]
MITEFGKYLRKIRIEQGLRLYDMAKSLGRSSAWLSYVETGRKSIPVGFADEIADKYNLAEKQREELNKAASKSAKDFKLNVATDASETRINAAYALARKFEDIDDETLGEFLKILNEKT